MATTATASASESANQSASSTTSTSPPLPPPTSSSTTSTSPPPPIQLCKHWLKSKSCLYYNKGLCKFSHPENYEIPKYGETKKQKSQRQSQRQRQRQSSQSSQSSQQSQNNNPNRHRSIGGRLQTRNDARVAQLRCFIATTIKNKNENKIKMKMKGRDSNSNSNSNNSNSKSLSLSTLVLELEKCNVLDVAGGKGELAFQLLNLNNVQSCYVVDPRPLKLNRFQRRLQKGYYHRSSAIIQTDIIRNQNLIERNVDHLYCFFSNELWVDNKHKDKDKDNKKEDKGEDANDEEKEEEEEEKEQKHSSSSRKIEFDKNIYKSKGWIWPPVGDDNNEHDSYCKNCSSSNTTTTTTTKKTKTKNDDAKAKAAELISTTTATTTTVAMAAVAVAVEEKEKETEIVTTASNNNNNNNNSNSNSNSSIKNNYNDTKHQQQHLLSSIPTFQYALDVVSKCNLIVGMHPDQAVDAIIDAALYKNISFFVVPCCTYSREFPNRRIPIPITVDDTHANNNGNGNNENEKQNQNQKQNQKQKTTKVVTTYDELLQYLENKSSDIKRHVLPFEGRNVCLYRVV